MQDFVFVYAKDSKIKALNIGNAQKLSSKLIKEGWIHTQTIDFCKWLEYLHNECKDVDFTHKINSLNKLT